MTSLSVVAVQSEKNGIVLSCQKPNSGVESAFSESESQGITNCTKAISGRGADLETEMGAQQDKRGRTDKGRVKRKRYTLMEYIPDEQRK